MFKAGFVVGVLGDAFLQYSVKNELFGFKKDEGLGLYFQEWDPLSSLLAAGFLTGGISWAYEKTGFGEANFPFYAVFIDDIYRIYHPYIYPTLGHYYDRYSETETRTFNAITAFLVLGAKKLI